MKTNYKLLLFAWLLPAFCFGQKNFKQGYVVSLKGDTLKGYIDYREWDNNPAEINFKADATAGNTTTFSLTNALAFGVTGLEAYQRFTVPVSLDGISATDAAFGRDTVTHLQTVFLKTLVKGDNVNLYSYADDLKTRYYFAEKGNIPDELKYWLYNDGDGVKHNKRYQAQLTYLALKFKPNSPAIIQAIAKTEYTESDLIKLTKMVNSTNNAQQASTDNAGAQFFVGAGINYTHTTFTGDIIFEVSNTTDKATPMPYVTAGINLYVNKVTRKLYFVMDLTLKADHHQLHSVAASQASGTSTIIVADAKSDYSQYSAAFSPQIAYNFYNAQKLKVFANLGIVINLSTYSDHSLVQTTNVNSTPEIVNNYPAFEKLWVAPVLKAGVTLNQKIDLYAGFQKKSLFTNNLFYEGDLTGYLIGMHYFFGK